MPSSISPELEAHLNGEVLTVAQLFKVVRRDGVVMGFAGHDQSITFGGLGYEASDSMASTAIETSADASVNNMDISGILSSDRITESDLINGVYDLARIEARLVNYRDLTMGAKVLGVGFIGRVSCEDGQFSAEVRWIKELLNQVVGDTTSKTARCRLGDARCKLNMSGNATNGFPIRATRSLASGSGLNLTFGGDNAPATHYRYGTVKWLTGANAGLSRDVKTHANGGGTAVITLRTPFPFAVAFGDTAVLEAGCDGVFETCRDKFANANNFHGEPFIPGNAKVTQVGRAPG